MSFAYFAVIDNFEEREFLCCFVNVHSHPATLNEDQTRLKCKPNDRSQFISTKKKPQNGKKICIKWTRAKRKIKKIIKKKGSLVECYER